MRDDILFVPDQIYRRRDLHKQWGGQERGGISTPKVHKLIFVFTGETGRRHGYRDELSADGIFSYTGEGQRGDMRFVSGNRAIRDHVRDGKDLHVFKQVRKGFVRYVGQMVCTGSGIEDASDTDGKSRKAIVFELTPIEAFSLDTGKDDKELAKNSLESLRQQALASASASPTPKERKSVYIERSKAIKLYVLMRASGKCEGCGLPAPFKKKDGQPYLEPHHIRRLSDGGPDHPRWVIGVCPNCHRRAHHADDSEQYNDRLAEIVGALETEE